ncbi:hypothetical protein NC652_018258 [Populus alba x Populus x berolinensis]|nr:hypothetical protein NC652_018258 [Populus alba x Populus x berolinensis]
MIRLKNDSELPEHQRSVARQIDSLQTQMALAQGRGSAHESAAIHFFIQLSRSPWTWQLTRPPWLCLTVFISGAMLENAL